MLRIVEGISVPHDSACAFLRKWKTQPPDGKSEGHGIPESGLWYLRSMLSVFFTNLPTQRLYSECSERGVALHIPTQKLQLGTTSGSKSDEASTGPSSEDDVGDARRANNPDFSRQQRKRSKKLTSILVRNRHCKVPNAQLVRGTLESCRWSQLGMNTVQRPTNDWEEEKDHHWQLRRWRMALSDACWCCYDPSSLASSSLTFTNI